MCILYGSVAAKEKKKTKSVIHSNERGKNTTQEGIQMMTDTWAARGSSARAINNISDVDNDVTNVGVLW